MMDDLISRQAAIDALRYAQHRFTVADEAGGMGTVKWSEDVIYFAEAERVLSVLPSAQPVRHGRFIGTEYDGYADGSPVFYEWKCSECGCIFEDEEPTYNYCPNCGADMRGEDHEFD